MSDVSSAVLYLITDLQALGEIVAARLMNLAQRKQRANQLFSEEDREDVLTYHQEILETFWQVLAALATHDLDLINGFLARKKARSHLKRELYLRHMGRLRAGNALSMASSAMQLDLLDAMSEMLSHITAMAYTLRESMEKPETWVAPEARNGAFTPAAVGQAKASSLVFPQEG